MSARGERTLFAAVALLTFAYVAVRAALVPLTHDEAATFQTYVLTGRYLPYLAHWDAGNHLLITAIGRGCYLLFGAAPLSLRAFNVLCFALYAWYAWRTTRLFEDGLIRMATAAALLLCPFLLDFFSLFRGYGASLAFLLIAAFHGLRWSEMPRLADLVLLFIALLLAGMASLTLLILWSGALALVLVMLVRHARSHIPELACWVLLGLLPLAFAATYSHELSSRGLLYYGTPDGLLRGTFPSLSEWVLGAGAHWMTGLLWLIPILLAAALWQHVRTAARILLLLVMAELAGRLILGRVFGVLYPMDRTAMHLVPLLLLLFAYGLDALRPRYAIARWAALLLLWLPLRTLAGLNMSHTRFWPEQAINEDIYRTALERQANSPRPLLVGGYRQNPRSWAYGSMRHGGALNFLDETGFPQPTCDLLLIDPVYFKSPDGFHGIAKAPNGRVALLERDRPLRTAVRSDSSWSVEQGVHEFVGLWSPNADALHGSEWLVDIEARLTTTAEPLELRVVLEVKDADGEMLHYDVVDLEDLGERWARRPLHVLRRLPQFAKEPARVACYWWNPRLQSYGADHVRVRVHEVLPD